MNDTERKETIESIALEVENKGKLNTRKPDYKFYELSLPYCLLGLVKYTDSYKGIILRVAENFFDPNIKLDDLDMSFDGLRTVYNADYDGLYNIQRQGIRMSELMHPSPYLMELRSRKLSNLTREDTARLDTLLQYAKTELLE